MIASQQLIIVHGTVNHNSSVIWTSCHPLHAQHKKLEDEYSYVLQEEIQNSIRGILVPQNATPRGTDR